jgi:hypothetical protein
VAGSPIMKDGELLSPTYADWVRSLPCAFCGRPPRSEQHHYPNRGARGCINDIRSVPACRRCHIRCGGHAVVEKGKRHAPILSLEQELAVALTWLRFHETAPWLVVERVMVDVKTWRDSRIYVEVPS